MIGMVLYIYMNIYVEMKKKKMGYVINYYIYIIYKMQNYRKIMINIYQEIIHMYEQMLMVQVILSMIELIEVDLLFVLFVRMCILELFLYLILGFDLNYYVICVIIFYYVLSVYANILLLISHIFYIILTNYLLICYIYYLIYYYK